MLPTVFYEASTTLKAKLDKDIVIKENQQMYLLYVHVFHEL